MMWSFVIDYLESWEQITEHVLKTLGKHDFVRRTSFKSLNFQVDLHVDFCCDICFFSVRLIFQWMLLSTNMALIHWKFHQTFRCNHTYMITGLNAKWLGSVLEKPFLSLCCVFEEGMLSLKPYNIQCLTLMANLMHV